MNDPRRDAGARPGGAASSWVGGAAARHGWGSRQGIHSPEDRRFVGLAAAALDDYLARNPVAATLAGDTRFDRRLPDYSVDGVAEQVRVLNRHLLALEGIDPIGLSRVNAVDLDVLRRGLRWRVYQLATLQEPRWNPTWWSAALAIEPLLARQPVDIDAVLSRLRALPDHVEAARQTLRTISPAHLEVALKEARATPHWLMTVGRQLQQDHPGAAADLAAAVEEAAAAVDDHRIWLASRISHATFDPRLGERRYEEMLRLYVGTSRSAASIKADAEASLEQLRASMRSLASRQQGRSMASRRLVESALESVAAAHALSGDSVLPAAQRSMEAARSFTIEHSLVTVPDFDVDVIAMPSVRSGTAVVFSEAPGPLAPGRPPARVAVAGPEQGWSASRVQSFNREYNGAMLDAMMAHQAVPGHALQGEVARSVSAPTAIRSVFPDPGFVEGWAVYAQDLLMRHGYPGASASGDPTAFALQQTKLLLRGVVNALLDIGYHTGDLDEPQARRLLATAAQAEEGEFVVKWRRVRTTAGTLATYFVGLQAMRELVGRITEQHPRWSEQRVHDAALMHGAAPPRAVADLLGII